MKIYRWYAEKIGMGGLTAHTPGTSNQEIIETVYNYIIDSFDDMKFSPQQYTVEELRIDVWPIDMDDDYNVCYPNTVATHY